MNAPPSPLPYTDSKPVGAADFYMAINATFRFILKRFGMEQLQRYWSDLGSQYFAPVSARWSEGGLPAIAAHWRAFFEAEPGAEVVVEETTESVVVNVRVCPALKHLHDNNREVVPCFCQHCYFMSEAMAKPAGYAVRIQGGNGACQQTFRLISATSSEQNLSDIKEVTSC